MRDFTFQKTRDEASALAKGADNDAAFLAGGTTLVDLMKLEVMRPAALVDVSALPLTKIEPTPDGGLRIGALVKNSDLAYAQPILEAYPLVSQALLSGATPQIRNMATTAGNVLQRTRCLYFRDVTTPCNKRKPGSGCGAIDGESRNCAVLGVSDKCIAAHPSDFCVALVALDATVHTKGPKGERAIPFADFHREPGDRPEVENALEHGELIVAVSLPKSPYAKHAHYLKVRERAQYAFALVSVAAALDMDGKTVKSARLALGGVGAKPWRARSAEALLAGKTLDKAALAAIGEEAMKGAKTTKKNAFKVELAKRTIARALEIAGGAA